MDYPATANHPDMTGEDLRTDALLPAQFYPERRQSASAEPILRLMGSVLADAVRSFQRNFGAHQPEKRQEFREARFWIFQDKHDGPFSFEDVCDTLGIDPHRLRELIVQWEKNKQPGDEPHMIRRPAVRADRQVRLRQPRA
jgi:hypothetical protein